MSELICDRCGRVIPPDDLATGVCWSCGFMYDLDKVTDGFYSAHDPALD